MQKLLASKVLVHRPTRLTRLRGLLLKSGRCIRMRVRKRSVPSSVIATTCTFQGMWNIGPLSLFARTQETAVKLRDKIRRYLNLSKPDSAAGRRANRSIRRPTGISSAAGVNHVWAMSRHDKWERFGLFWHGCVDGFSGKILWLDVWWNISNPKYVCAQYLKAVQNFGGTFQFSSPWSMSCLIHKQVHHASPRVARMRRKATT